ncbi:MAG: hypothetical protein ABFS03_10345 [Chloroflexota bacterium]
MLRKKQSLTRAEQVRAKRRAVRAADSHATPNERDGWARGVPPVMIRGDVKTLHSKQSAAQKRKRIKRRLDVALSSPGVEVRLPAVPVLNMGWRFVSLVLTAGLAALLIYFWQSPIYRVQAAEVDGGVWLESESINRALTIYNQPIFMISPRVLETLLLNRYQGGIESVQVHVSLPAKVVVALSEREPVLIWEQDGQENKWVDLQGIGFPIRGNIEGLARVKASAAPPVPRFDDFETHDNELNPLEVILTPEMVLAILTLQKEASESLFLVYDDQHGLGWRTPQDWDVYFGMDISDIDIKLSVYQAIVEHLQAEGINPALISVEQIDAPIYRMVR